MGLAVLGVADEVGPLAFAGLVVVNLALAGFSGGEGMEHHLLKGLRRIWYSFVYKVVLGKLINWKGNLKIGFRVNVKK